MSATGHSFGLIVDTVMAPTWPPGISALPIILAVYWEGKAYYLRLVSGPYLTAYECPGHPVAWDRMACNVFGNVLVLVRCVTGAIHGYQEAIEERSSQGVKIRHRPSDQLTG